MAERKTSRTPSKRTDVAAYFEEAAVSSCTSTNSTKFKTARRTFTTSQTFLTQSPARLVKPFQEIFQEDNVHGGVSSILFSWFVEAPTEGELSGDCSGKGPTLLPLP